MKVRSENRGCTDVREWSSVREIILDTSRIVSASNQKSIEWRRNEGIVPARAAEAVPTASTKMAEMSQSAAVRDAGSGGGAGAGDSSGSRRSTESSGSGRGRGRAVLPSKTMVHA
ncbi:MAG: hypothetical protein AMXMBFR67_15370 [Nitrospira sp.]